MPAYSAGHFGLSIDGHKVSAYIRSVEGGFSKANVVDEAVGPDNLHVKHLSTREVDPISVEMGLSGCRQVLEWISDSWNRRFSRRSGQVVHADFNHFGKFEHEFTDALIQETTFSALDGRTKETGYLKVKFLPEAVKSKASNTPRIVTGATGDQKMWHDSKFRLRLDGVDTSKAAKLDPFTIKQGVKAMHTGRELFPQIEPTKIEFPDISVYMALEYSNSIMAWYDQMVRAGGRDPSLEKTGAIEYLDPKLSTIFTIKLSNVGVKNFTIPRARGKEEEIKRAKIDLYVGSMSLEPGPGM